MSIEEKELTFNFATEGGIPYRLMSGFPTFDVSEDASTAQEEYVINAADMQGFLLESFPITFDTNDPFKKPKRYMPGTTAFQTKKLNFKPFQGARCCDPFGVYAGTPGFAESFTKYLLATIDYETPPQGESDDPNDNPQDPIEFLEHSVSSGGEFLMIPPHNIDSEDIDETNKTMANNFQPLVKILPSFEHGFKWQKVKSPNWTAIRELLGKINNSSFKPAFDAPTETTLFTGVSASRKYTWNGRQVRAGAWDIDFKFSQRAIKDADKGWITWNHVFHPKLGWIRVTQKVKGKDKPLYEMGNFETLFVNSGS